MSNHAYGDLVVLSRLNLSCRARAADRPGLDRTGAGKIDALKLLEECCRCDTGTREPGHNVRVGYFSQNRIDVLNTKLTVLESALDAPNPVSEQTARTVLGAFLFAATMFLNRSPC